MLSWYAAMGCGAIGGLVVEAVVFWGRLQAWRETRLQTLATDKPKPTLREFLDPAPDLAVAVTRALLGAVMGALLHSQLTGVYAAVAVGAAAPSLLTQISSRTNLPPETTE
ncbi:hypothetical protein [Amycolatopsis sp. WGS_07]|uniref:hypothetical protein n=1 Tax=Amycolatopsis sp. WGS_07 TaxID=3076764 RepID=UPI003872E5A6